MGGGSRAVAGRHAVYGVLWFGGSDAKRSKSVQWSDRKGYAQLQIG